MNARTADALGSIVLAALLPLVAACTSETPKEPPAVSAAAPQPAPRPTPSATATGPAKQAQPALVDLPVRFTGSVIRADASQSRAMLSVGGASTREMKVGEQVAEGITLADIREDQVTLQAGMLSRRIPIERGVAAARPASAPAMPPVAAPAPAPANIDEAFRQAIRNQLGGQK